MESKVKEEAKTAKCPTCGGKYLVATNYCVKCKKKVKTDKKESVDAEETVLSERAFDLGSGHLGNGILVWNRAREVHGDYEKVAHIDSDRNIKWYIKNPPREVVDYVNDIATGESRLYLSL